jgi:hypothetical protein
MDKVQKANSLVHHYLFVALVSTGWQGDNQPKTEAVLTISVGTNYSSYLSRNYEPEI